MPFSDLTTGGPPVIDLRIGSSPTSFYLVNGFRYQDERDADELVDVGPQPTDLASVPFFLQWLVRSYGRHTMAALVHDHLWRTEPKNWDNLARANRLFRHAMWELGVPWIRRWFMWAAVELGMYARFLSGILALVVWALCMGTGTAVALGTKDYEMSWGAAKALLMGGVVFLGVTLVVALAAWLSGLGAEAGQARARWNSMAKGAAVTGPVALGVGIVATASAAISNAISAAVTRWEWLPDEPACALGALAVLGLGVWGQHVGAGVIATFAAFLLAVPVVGVLAGLLVYAVLEIAGLLILGTGRGVLWLAHSKPRGKLNPMFKRPFQLQ